MQLWARTDCESSGNFDRERAALSTGQSLWTWAGVVGIHALGLSPERHN